MSGDSRMKPGSSSIAPVTKLLMSGDSFMMPGSSSIAPVTSFFCLVIII